MIRVGVVCYGAPADPRAGTVQCWTRTVGSVILLQLTGTPAALLIGVASPQEGGLFRCTGAAILQRCRCDNGSEFGEDLRVVPSEITAEPEVADQARKVAGGNHQIEHRIPIGRRDRFELALQPCPSRAPCGPSALRSDRRSSSGNPVARDPPAASPPAAPAHSGR